MKNEYNVYGGQGLMLTLTFGLRS